MSSASTAAKRIPAGSYRDRKGRLHRYPKGWRRLKGIWRPPAKTARQWQRDANGVWLWRDPLKGWYRDRKGAFHRLLAKDGWYYDRKARRWRNRRPAEWYLDRYGIWRHKAVPPPPAKPAVVTPPAPGPAPPSPPAATPLSVAQAERLLWRAGFGPRPGEAAQLSALGLDAAVNSLVDVATPSSVTGPEPTSAGAPLDPSNAFNHDHTWWLDRMVRADHPLAERMALVWHDWFATSAAGVDSQALMLVQADLLRTHALGDFQTLLKDITHDPAMLAWLNGDQNRKGNTNENYGREVMELFTLGADRGAYTETDVREMARAFTGWRRINNGRDAQFDGTRWDSGNKTIFGRTGAYKWDQACDLCLTHPLHASFFVTKLWGYFIPTAPSAATVSALEGAYLANGYSIKETVRAILKQSALYDGPSMVKPPIVHIAGLHRAVAAPITSTTWADLGSQAGQRLFYPPDVSGWDDSRWLDTNTLRGRWQAASTLLNGRAAASTGYDPDETPQQALDAALAFWKKPTLSASSTAVLLAYATSSIPGSATSTSARQQYKASRQNALRMLIAMSPDLQVC